MHHSHLAKSHRPGVGRLQRGPEGRFGCRFFFFFNKFIYLFLAALGLRCCMRLSLVAASGGYPLLQRAGFSLQWLLLLWSMGSRCTGSVVVAHRLSCSVACGILPDQGSNPCPLPWQADSQPLHHQGSPQVCFDWRLLAGEAGGWVTREG